jgi:diguanylate cyclase (GGDEF)-like protein
MDRGARRRLRPFSGTATAGVRAWSVRSYLVACVVAAFVVLIVLEVVLAAESMTTATHRARSRAAFEAALASTQLQTSIRRAEGALLGVAGSLDVATLKANPAACSLNFSSDAPGSSGHIDIVLPDGSVPCTSIVAHGAPAGAAQPHAPWLAPGATVPAGPAVSTVFDDGLGGGRSIAVTVPIGDPSTHQGVIAMVLALEPLAAGITADFGGPDHFVFAVTGADGTLLSSSGSGADAMPVTGARSGWIQASQDVPALGLTVVAGRRSAEALAATRSLLTREALAAALALLVVLALLALVNRRIATPLRRLAHAVAKAAREVMPQPVDVEGPAELRQVADQFNDMIAARVSFENQLSHDALHDPLTGLANRVLLIDRLTVACERTTDADTTTAVLAIGIDRFELVNTSLGYRVGDEALVALASRIESALRPRQTLARLGGGEFAIALPDIADRDAALAEAAAVLRVIAKPLDAAGTMLALTASVGVAVGDGDMGAEELLRNATTAMHSAKEHGGARYELFEPSLRVRANTRLRLENDLSRALDRGELFVEYQPVVNLPSGRITGAEALVRWRHPSHGVVSPMTFVPLAEETGAIDRIGQFVLRSACEQAVSWRRMGYRMRVSVNVSGRQLLNGGFADRVTDVLGVTGLAPDQLCLELTESTLMEDVLRISNALHALKGNGISLSVDDFGTGYSSLSYLQRFPVDELKIDRSFVGGLGQTDDRNLVAAVIGIAHALELRIVAEGVETQSQATQLITLGCRSAQGFFYGKPQAPGTLTAALPRQHVDVAVAAK